MNVDESRIRAIEREIDQHYKEQSFLKLPPSIAIQYILLAFEYAVSPNIYKEEKIPYLYPSTHALFQRNKEALMESMNWIGEIKENEEYKIINVLDSSTYRSAEEFLSLGDAYHAAVSAYIMWSRGQATAKLIDDATLRFEYNPEQIRYDVLDMKLSDKTRDEVLKTLNQEDLPFILRAKRIVEMTVKQTGENNLSYSLREIDISQMMTVALKLIKGFMNIPFQWKIFQLNLDELERFWASLVSIGMLHLFAVDYAFNKFSFKDDLLANMIIIRPLSDWCRQISRWTELTREKVERMLNLHIYSAKHRKPDIVLTPFIKVSDKHLAVSPNLLITNNLSRNFIKHFAKNHKNEFDRTSYVFEDTMIDKIKANIYKENIQIRTKIRIADKTLPDVDVCLIDKDNMEIMLCECRWTIPAADPYEVGDKVDIEKEKLRQMVRLKEFILQNAGKLSDFVKLDKKILFKEIFFVIVFENHGGSALTFNEDIPIIDLGIFIDLINANKFLGESFGAIKSRKYLPKKDIDFKIKEEIHKIGKFKIYWTGFYA